MSSPIHIGILGLGKGEGGLVPGLWAAKGHLPYLLSSPKYKVVAVCNSTVESSQASIDFHKLGSDVKAYGTPEDIANDPNVDMVAVCVQVGKHYKLTKPALLAGKDVFVEWPLGASTSEAEELNQLAKAKGVKTVVGLQARASPVVTKMKDLIQNGTIGNVLSSIVVSSFSGLPTGMWPSGAEYYLSMNSGGNVFTIYFGHCISTYITTLMKSH
jgi:predicted dehydrogenase